MGGEKRILIVEDDKLLARLIRDYLQKQRFDVLIEYRGDCAVRRICDEKPDLVILDLMLPGMDGLTICHEVRRGYDGLIIILTAREDDTDQVVGLEMGADDYVKKPVEPRVLLARIRALFRRTRKKISNKPTGSRLSVEEEMVFGRLRIRRTSFKVEFAGQEIKITTHEFDLLWILAENAGKVMGRDVLYQMLRGFRYDGLDRCIDVLISKLRKKLEDDVARPKRIKTIWGQGYLFVKDAW